MDARALPANQLSATGGNWQARLHVGVPQGCRKHTVGSASEDWCCVNVRGASAYKTADRRIRLVSVNFARTGDMREPLAAHSIDRVAGVAEAFARLCKARSRDVRNFACAACQAVSASPICKVRGLIGVLLCQVQMPSTGCGNGRRTRHAGCKLSIEHVHGQVRQLAGVLQVGPDALVQFPARMRRRRLGPRCGHEGLSQACNASRRTSATFSVPMAGSAAPRAGAPL